MLEGFTPAEAFPPGEYLADELAERGWTIAQFASIIGRPTQAVSEIINGRKEITPDTALEIAAATGTSAQTWLRLQDAYRLWKLSHDGESTTRLDRVQRRARLTEVVPVRELVKRGVIPEADVDAQEAAVCELLGISSLDETPRFAMAARRGNSGEPLTPPQVAWLACVRRAASSISSVPLDRDGLAELSRSLTTTITSPEHLAAVPDRFAAVGVRVVHVPRFGKSKIDGSAFSSDGCAVIALSGRIARFDSVLFTLLHEAAHIYHGHSGYTMDDEIQTSPGATPRESAADHSAAQWALPRPPSIQEPISRAKVLRCAEQLGVHPAVVVGRLHHDGKLAWSHLNNLIPNVREHLNAW